MVSGGPIVQMFFIVFVCSAHDGLTSIASLSLLGLGVFCLGLLSHRADQHDGAGV